MTRFDGPYAGLRAMSGSWPRWLAGAFAACTMLIGAPVEAEAQNRTLKLYHVHNRERAEITYRRGNSYDAAALKKINMFMRDWRKNEPTKMDPRVLDVLWEVYHRTGAKGEINIIGGYRSPATNSMLRSRSKGVAKNSQHTMGKAIDFFIPGVSLKSLRNAGLQLQAGGVGYYPSSGSPFVHMDVGNVRHWPRIGESEMASIMKGGSRMSSGATTVVASAAPRRSGGLLSAFFGRGAEEEDGESVEKTPAARPAARPTARPAKPLPGIEIVPPEMASPAVRPAPEPEELVQTPETIIAALPARRVPVPAFAPRPQADVGIAAAAIDDALQDPATAVTAEPEPTTEVALGIPLPSWRPNYTPAKPDVDAKALLAMASADVAPDVEKIAAPLPMERPAVSPVAKQGRVAVASAPAVEPFQMAEASTQPVKVAMAEPVKTTRKDPRPTKAAAKPAPKPMVVAAPPASARWALDKNYVSANTKGTSAPSYAYNVVRTAPLQVYTAGFQQGSDGANVHRFTGKAVEFLSVARFEND